MQFNTFRSEFAAILVTWKAAALSQYLTLALVVLIATSPVNAAFTVYSNPAAIAIPSGPGASTPYPSTITVSNGSPFINTVIVQLRGLTHTFPDDLDIVLVGPNGTAAMLMSDCGGGGNVSGITVTFQDLSGPNPPFPVLPDTTQISAGQYTPSNYNTAGDTVDSFPGGGPSSWVTTLALFNGTSANGQWRLYVYDDTAQDSGTISMGWSLSILGSGTSAPSNNTCSNGSTNVIPSSPSAGNTSTVTGSFSDATADGNCTCDGNQGKDVWHNFTPAVTGTYTLSLCSSASSVDSVLSIHTACAGSDGNQVGGSSGCNDDGCVAFGPSILSNISLNSGTPYRVRVAGYSNFVDSGPYTLVTTYPPSPTLGISGTITNCNTGTGIAGATVQWGTFSTTSNGSGSYNLGSNLPCQTASFTVSASGYQTFGPQSYTPSCSTNNVKNACLNPNPTLGISGTITNCNTGSGIAGATVQWGSFSTSTNASGAYNLGSSLPCQTATFTVAATGYQTFSQSNYTPTCLANNVKNACLEVDTPACGPGFVLDCNGNCAPTSWIGDGICDNGEYSYNGQPIYFDCSQFKNDEGDCDEAPLPPPSPHNPPPQPPAPPPPAPVPAERNLLFITHGCCTTFDEYQTDWMPLEAELEALLGEEWQVIVYGWTPTELLYVFTGYPPGPALTRAIERGEQLGQQINWTNYDHVHLMSHSAGAPMITMMASHAHNVPGGPTVHLTYLDAYAGVLPIPGGGTVALQSIYGLNSDWADHYLTWDIYGYPTYIEMANAHNVDVSELDQEYSEITNFSSHAWPICFYHYTINQGFDPCRSGPVGGSAHYGQYGFGLSKYALGTNWIATVSQPQYERGLTVELSPGGGFAAAPPPTGNLVYRIRNDAVINPSSTPHTTSTNNTVAVGSNGFTATTEGSAAPGEAWITMQIETTQPINFIKYSAEFTSDPGAEGVLTAYVNDVAVSTLDERFSDAGVNHRTPMLEADLAPGTHFIAFRLDQFGAVPTSVIVSNIATGWGGFVSPADLNVDGIVGVPDLLQVINAWGACDAPPAECPADIAPSPDGDGVVGVPDLLMVINNWGP